MWVSAASFFVVQIQKTETLLYVNVLPTPTRMEIDESASKVRFGWSDEG
jgi:hypothetical protein